MMLARRPAVLENKQRSPEQVSMSGLEVLPGKVQGGFPFFL